MAYRLLIEKNRVEAQEKPHMKYLKPILAGAILLFAIPSMALAQESMYGEKMNKFLNDHPDVGEKVRANPSLLYDKHFREEHPDLQRFMQNHPEEYKRLNEHGAGAYDEHHQWHDDGWWHDHEPNWVREHHPEWFDHHPEWGPASSTNAPYGVGHPGEVAAVPGGEPPPPPHHHHHPQQ